MHDPTEAVFLQEILGRPDDDAPRLIYADFLADQGDDRGDWLRRDWELRGTPGRAAFTADLHRHAAARGLLPYDGLLLTREQFLFCFRLRLAETIAYCAGREQADLRSWELEPRSLIGRSSARGWPYDDDIDWREMVLEVAITRRRLLERGGRAPTRPANGLAGGRLMLYDPHVAISYGEAMTWSNGYFDADGLPPWDTWVVQMPEASPVPREDPRRATPHYLIAWVPPALVPRANVGIETNQEGCLRWLHEVTTPFVRQLREGRLV